MGKGAGEGVRSGEPRPEQQQHFLFLILDQNRAAGTPRPQVLGPRGSAAPPLWVACRMVWQNEQAPSRTPDVRGETPRLPEDSGAPARRGISQKALQTARWWPRPAGFMGRLHSAPTRTRSEAALRP